MDEKPTKPTGTTDATATDLRIRGGDNIAIKVPTYSYEPTVAFYRDLLGLPDAGEELGSPGFRFGANTLWIDHVPRYARSDVWLQVRTPDVDAAADRLAAAAVPFREEVEPYDDLPGYWISDPSGVIIRLSPE